MTKGKELKVFKEKNYQALLTLMNHCIKNKTGLTLGAFDEEKKLVAAAFFIQNNERHLFLNSGVTDQGRVHGAMHFIFDYLICNNSGKNSLLDFGGSSVETVARFYKSFGAKEIVYLQIKKNNLPFPLKLIKK